MIAVIKRLYAFLFGFSVLLGMLCTLPATVTIAQATPVASPQASPVAIDDGCAGLGVYVKGLADLTLDNEGLVILREVGFDALALSADDAVTVVASIDRLLPELRRIAPPEAARPYHSAYLEVMAWYRNLAADRDEASHQRLINQDRRLFGLMGLAIQSGQLACGYDTWTNAYEAAFPPEE